MADESHLETGARVDGRDQRDEALRGKEHVSYAVPRLGKYFGKPEFESLAVSEEAFTIMTR
jgi:hypothetical protein